MNLNPAQTATLLEALAFILDEDAMAHEPDLDALSSLRDALSAPPTSTPVFTLRVTTTYDVEVEAADADTAYDALDVGTPTFGVVAGFTARIVSSDLLAYDVEDIS